MDKSLYPPNVPQARPIENFWGDLAQKVYDDGWEVKKECQLMLRIKKNLNTIHLFYSLFERVHGQAQKYC